MTNEAGLANAIDRLKWAGVCFSDHIEAYYKIHHTKGQLPELDSGWKLDDFPIYIDNTYNNSAPYHQLKSKLLLKIHSPDVNRVEYSLYVWFTNNALKREITDYLRCGYFPSQIKMGADDEAKLIVFNFFRDFEYAIKYRSINDFNANEHDYLNH